MTRTGHNQRDAGLTLPELLIGVALTGLLVSALSFALIVIIRQVDNNEGRLNNARSEQGVNMWMPADLASATLVHVEPNQSPCFGACPSNVALDGTNALMLTWTDKVPNAAGNAVITMTTNVSYRYVLVGEEYRLVRVECTSREGANACRSNIVLRNLDAPPLGTPYVEGETAPTWILSVNKPLAADATTVDGPLAVGAQVKNAQRITVTINGGGDVDGAGGGTSQINLSAGGANTSLIDASSLQGAPSLVAARSRCGGAIALIVDASGSIGSTAMTQVRDALTRFVNTFTGTPVKLELVRFSTSASILGAGSQNSRFFDMLVDADVAELEAGISTLASNGGTNWEDALHRTFFASNGAVQAVLPKLVVFFTDGVPTRSRLNNTSASGPTDPPARLSPLNVSGWTQIDGSTLNYNQEALYRANVIAAQFRDTVQFIGVGVGPDAKSNVDWITGVPGWHYDYTRRFNATYTRWYHIDDRSGSAPNYTWTPGSSTNPSNPSKRVSFSAPFSKPKSVLMPDRAYTDLATSFTNPSGNRTNQQLYDLNNNGALADSDASDGWTRTKTYTSTGTESEPATAADYGQTGVIRTRVYTAPFTNYDPPVKVSTPSDKVLGRLIAGSDLAVQPATTDASGNYDNAKVANMYTVTDWAKFTDALQAVALNECGGTLTVQTKNAGVPAADPFSYQKTAVTNWDGTSLASDQTVVTTTKQFPSGTFDFNSDKFVTVEIQPQNLSDLTGYTPGSWSCKAGVTPRSFTAVAIPNSVWTGIQVKVAANEAVSCTLEVSR